MKGRGLLEFVVGWLAVLQRLHLPGLLLLKNLQYLELDEDLTLSSPMSAPHGSDGWYPEGHPMIHPLDPQSHPMMHPNQSSMMGHPQQQSLMHPQQSSSFHQQPTMQQQWYHPPVASTRETFPRRPSASPPDHSYGSSADNHGSSPPCSSVGYPAMAQHPMHPCSSAGYPAMAQHPRQQCSSAGYQHPMQQCSGAGNNDQIFIQFQILLKNRQYLELDEDLIIVLDCM